MSGRHEDRPHTRVGLRWVVAAAALLTLLVSFAATGPAGAASKTVKTQLSLSGLASADNPLGGSVIGIRPGDKVTISPALLPTAGLDKLGLGGLVGSLLSGLAKFQVTADLRSLPGGAANTKLSGTQVKTFSFPKAGTYNFTWTAQSVSVLGIVPINLDGNQLEKAKVKLNADNEYVGSIVVSNNPPKGGISIQLPKVKIAPSLPVLGQLPTISLPGVSAPTIQVPVPDLNPTKAAGGGATKAPTKAASSPGLTYTPPGLSIPDLVVPQGNSGGGGDSGTDSGVLAEGSNGLLPQTNAGSAATNRAATSGGGSQDLPAYNSGSNKTIDLAAETGTPTSQVPVILAILAIIALALVAGTYARLFLLKKQT